MRTLDNMLTTKEVGGMYLNTITDKTANKFGIIQYKYNVLFY